MFVMSSDVEIISLKIIRLHGNQNWYNKHSIAGEKKKTKKNEEEEKAPI